MSATARKISKQASRYLAGQISLNQFEDWFVPATWDNHKSNDSRAESLADDIEMFLSEYRDGVLTREEFRQELEAATRPFAGAVLRFGEPIDGTVPVPKESLASGKPFMTGWPSTYATSTSRPVRFFAEVA